MGKPDLELAVKSFDLKHYNEQFKLAEEYRKDFVYRFSVSRIRSMAIDEYAQGKGIKKDNFTYELEWRLGSLGKISGASAKKFGIYYSQTEKDYVVTRIWKRDSIDGSISVLRHELANLIEAGQMGDFNTIRQSPFSKMVKGKILATYFPEKYLSIFSEDHINYFIHRLFLDEKVHRDDDILDKRQILIEFKNSHPIMKRWPLHAFAHFLYTVYPGSPSKDETISYIENIELITGDFYSFDESNPSTKNGKYDYEANSKYRVALGERGEYVALQYEKKQLLAQNIRKKPFQISLEDDSAGYDIVSYCSDGTKKYIEVKATNSSPKDFRFYLSSNELRAARSFGDKYHLYVVFKPNCSTPKIFDLGNPFIDEGLVNLIPVTYKVHLSKN